ncbi:MAG TPA: AAA family ATPase [Polyangia bacterium]|nr:AAA family ATPase [Polyangia bacterium]
MYIERVRIENIRGFRDGSLSVDIDFRRPDNKLPGWTVIAGRNGTGKSSFLKAIALAVAGPSAARTLLESYRGWVHEGSTTGTVNLGLIPHEKDRFQGLGKIPKNFDAELRWSVDAASVSLEPSLEASPKKETKLRGPWRGPWTDNPKGWFVAGYGPFRRLTGHAADAQRLMVAPNHVSRLVSLFREDASLVECVQWLKSVYLRRLEGREGARELEAAVLQLLNDGLLPDDTAVERVDSDGLWVSQSGTTLPLRELSDGYRVSVALVLDIVRQLFECYGEFPLLTTSGGDLAVQLPGVVIADEIDAHLHVSWQQRIGFWLKSRFPFVQFLVSTHSPFICQAADPRGLIRLPAPGENATASHVPEDVFKSVVHGGADTAVLTSLFGLERTWSEDTERLRTELARLRAKEITGKASLPEKARIKDLQMELPLGPSTEVDKALREITAVLDIDISEQKTQRLADASDNAQASNPKD